MIDGKRYLIIKKQDDNCYPIKLAYWFDKRVTKEHIYEEGFYGTKYFYYPHKNVVWYVDADMIPDYTKCEKKEPVEGERYLVCRVGNTGWYSPHYTIRKFHNGSFGSKDAKYWTELFDIVEELMEYDKS